MSYLREVAASFTDFAESIRQSRLWFTLANNDIAGRYRGSVLGPWWITLTSIAFVVGIGLVYSELMGVPADRYVPWMATGVVLWNMFSATISEGANSYLEGAGIIQQTNIPLPVFVWRVIYRNLLNFAHQIVVIFGVALYFHYLPGTLTHLPLAIAGLVLVLLNLSWIAFACAIAAARFRDLQQVIGTVLQLLFFLSPVIWIPKDISRHGDLLRLNPMFHMLDVVRSPMMGHMPNMHSVAFLVAMAVTGWIFTFGLFAAVRRRIVHFL